VRGGRIRRASGGGEGGRVEADPHNKFKGKFVTSKHGAIVRAEDEGVQCDAGAVAVDYALGAAAAAVVSGGAVASNAMMEDAAPRDAAGNENETAVSSWWCGVCL